MVTFAANTVQNESNYRKAKSDYFFSAIFFSILHLHFNIKAVHIKAFLLWLINSAFLYHNADRHNTSSFHKQVHQPKYEVHRSSEPLLSQTGPQPEESQQAIRACYPQITYLHDYCLTLTNLALRLLAIHFKEIWWNINHNHLHIMRLNYNWEEKLKDRICGSY